ncbi:uncharacterized protein LOC126673717 isoform X1 [Mercurialis annua]|uniref:uncharacterized protein LOC126673717 isoform X1 n=1 Tax=Mercurialis annua TaxID=3986 RepID=UPI00216055AC|nr:uncharacterized protein LOC126673717 isoform X1 [Mercurialis annua]
MSSRPDDEVDAEEEYDQQNPNSKDLKDTKTRLKEIEEEAGSLREMQAKVENEMGAVPDSSRGSPSQAEKEEVNARSMYVGNDAIAQRLADASQPTTGESISSSPADVDKNQVFLNIESFNKKHCESGLGSAISKYVDTATSSRLRGSSSQSQPEDDDFERRVQAAIQERLRKITAALEERMTEFRRQLQASNEERMTALIRAEIAKIIPNLPPEYRPQFPPAPADANDTTSL